MTYKNAIIFIAGLACGFIGFWLVGILLTPNPSVSDNQLTMSATDIPISSPTTQKEHSVDQTATANVVIQSVPTPTRTELLAYQMALRSGREIESTEKFYRKMLPHIVRICDDMDGMSDVVNWLVYTHERIEDLGISNPDDLVDVSYNLYSILLETENKQLSKYEDEKCQEFARGYVFLRGQGHGKNGATKTLIQIIQEY